MAYTPGNFSFEAWWEKVIARTPVKYISLILAAVGGLLVWRFPGGYFWHSIGEAAEIIRRGAAEVMLGGSTEAGLVPLALASFNNMGAISRRNE